MSSPAQIAANRQNAQSSTGPKTEAGKAVSSQNSLSHGLSSTFQVLACEQQSAYEDLLRRMQAEMLPEGEHEQFLVEQMSQARWRLARIDRLETAALDALLLPEEAALDASPESRIIQGLSGKGRDPLAQLARYRAATERSYYRAYRELLQGRRANQRFQSQATENYIKQHIFGPTPGERARAQQANGFVSQNGAASKPAAPPAPNGFVSQNQVSPAQPAPTGTKAHSECVVRSSEEAPGY